MIGDAHTIRPNGHDLSELYVKKKYNNYKDEILKHISVKRYLLCWNKANKYMRSKVVRSLVATDDGVSFQFDIPTHTPITISNILSVILYCDMDRYSTKFSESFRKINPFETMYSVKRRNSKYWWQSKLLKETVICYGRVCQRLGTGTGPFCM